MAVKYRNGSEWIEGGGRGKKAHGKKRQGRGVQGKDKVEYHHGKVSFEATKAEREEYKTRTEGAWGKKIVKQGKREKRREGTRQAKTRVKKRILWSGRPPKPHNDGVGGGRHRRRVCRKTVGNRSCGGKGGWGSTGERHRAQRET